MQEEMKSLSIQYGNFQMKIVINPKENKKLLQHFPEDPYADITIITQSSTLHLVLAYLSIDSDYFSTLPPNTTSLNLSQMNQQPLIKVLKSLYGAQLIAYSVQQLFSLYEIIDKLQIEQYKILLKQSLQEILATQKENPILNSIEMLEFCITKGILVQEIKNFHFDTKLKILETSKNYLQLNKLSQSTLSSLLLDFHSLKVDKSDQIINHILQNYFNRKSIRPCVYFANQQLQQLKLIWQKYHHKITVTSQFTSSSEGKASGTLSNTAGNLGYGPTSITHIDTQMRKSQTNLNKMLKQPMQTVKSTIFKPQNLSQSEILDQKIQSLEDQLKIKDNLIAKLRQQLKVLKENNKEIEIDDWNDCGKNEKGSMKQIQKSKEMTVVRVDKGKEEEMSGLAKEVNNVARNFGKSIANKRIFQQIPK